MNAYWLILAPLIVLNLVVLPYFIFLLATALAAIVSSRDETGPIDPSSKLLIVIPAHNEESGIATTVKSCLSVKYPSLFFGVVVIADNCTDRTAALAREAGARVVERFDEVKKSKGYALEYLIGLLEQGGELGSLDALVIIDADTTIDAGLLNSFDRALRAGHDWIQAYYTVANPDQSWRTRLMTYALSLFNGVMPFGQNALGSSAVFKGNGMCFSTRGLRHRPWKSYGLVEDMEFSWTLRLAGEKIWLLRDVSVYGAMLGSGNEAAANQRRRWEFGRSEIRQKFLGPLMRSNELGWGEKLVSACELTLPTMTGITLIYAVVIGIDALAALALTNTEFTSVRGFLLACPIVMTLALALYAISPFLAMRLPWKYLPTIVFFPFYLIWKLTVSRGGRPERWIRTAREPHQLR